MKFASVVLVSALFGAGGVVVKGEVQENRAQEVRLAQLDTEVRMAELERELISTQVEMARSQYQAGAVGREAILSVDVALREAAANVERLSLEREELRLGGHEPSDAMSSPLVDGRDFVGARLDLDVQVAEGHLQLVEFELARTVDLYQQDVVGRDAVVAATAQLRDVQLRLELAQERLRLRRRFLAGEVTAHDVEVRAELEEARRDVERQELVVEEARSGLMTLEEEAHLGLAGDVSLQQARLQVMRAELSLELATLRVEQLEAEGEGR